MNRNYQIRNFKIQFTTVSTPATIFFHTQIIKLEVWHGVKFLGQLIASYVSIGQLILSYISIGQLIVSYVSIGQLIVSHVSIDQLIVSFIYIGQLIISYVSIGQLIVSYISIDQLIVSVCFYWSVNCIHMFLLTKYVNFFCVKRKCKFVLFCKVYNKLYFLDFSNCNIIFDARVKTHIKILKNV